MENELTSLQKDIQKLKSGSKKKNILLFFLFGSLISTFYFNAVSFKSGDIIRVQGIIVEDGNGRERILIGAPVPTAQNRIRTDSLRIQETWGKRLGPDYMQWYKEYNHAANGMIILDENGWDRIIIGDPTPDPVFGKRIGNSTGIIINDNQGLERTGYGILDVAGQDRVVLGLDKDNGTEGATLFILPDGSVGLNLNATNESMFLGKAAKGNWNSPNGKDFHGIILRDSVIQRLITVQGQKKDSVL